MAEILRAIEKSHAFLFVLSPDSASSRICGIEVIHALKHNKRIVVALYRQSDLQQLPERLAHIQWVPFVSEESFASSVVLVKKAVETDAAWLQRHTDLTILASHWERQGWNAGALLRAQALADAEQWLSEQYAQKDPAPSSLQEEFIKASRRHEDLESGENIVFEVQAMLARGRIRGASEKLTIAERLFARHNMTFLPSSIARWQLESLQPARIGRYHCGEESVGAIGWIPGTADYLVSYAGNLQRHSSFRDETLWIAAIENTEIAHVLAISRDGKRGAAGLPDGRAVVFDLETGTKIIDWRAHDDSITGLSFSAEGTMLASCALDSLARCWRIPEGTLGREFAGHRSPVAAVSLSPDGTLLATGSFGMHFNREQRAFNLAGHHVDHSLRVWLTATGRQLAALGNFEYGVRHIFFLPDGRRLLTAAINPFSGRNVGFHLWDSHTGELLKHFGIEASPLAGAALSEDGSTLLSADSEGLNVWQLPAGELVTKGELEEETSDRVSVDSTGSQGITATESGVLERWQLRRAKNIRVISLTEEGAAGPLAMSADGLFLAAGTSFRLEDLGSIMFTRETLEGREHPIWILDARTGFELCRLHGHRRSLSQMAFLPDSSGLLSLDDDGELVKWDLASASIVRTLVLKTSSIALAKDGKWLLTRSLDGPTRLLSFPPLDLIHEFPCVNPPVRDALFSEDGSRVIIASDKGKIDVCDTATGELLRTVDSSEANVTLYGLAVQGNTVFCANRNALIRRWEIETGAELRPITGTEGTVAYAVSADGKVLAIGTDEHTIRLLEVESSRLICDLEGPEAPITKLIFAPDNSCLAAGGDDGKLRIWPFSEPILSQQDKALQHGEEALPDSWLQTAQLAHFGEFQVAARRFVKARAECSDHPASAAMIAALGAANHALAGLRELQRVKGSAEFPPKRWELWFAALSSTLPDELAEAARQRDLDRINELLNAEAALANRQAKAGESALHIAAAAGDERLLKLLLDAGADLELADDVGRTALHFAAASGQEGIVKRLVAAGCHVNAATIEGHSTPLHLAAKRGHVSVIRELIAHGGDLDARTEDGWTPLHEAVESSEWTVEALLGAGADATAATAAGYTALHRAALLEKRRIVAILLDAGASVLDVDYQGCTALHFAASRASAQTIDFLLRMGADPLAEDRSGQTPLRHAVSNNNLDAAERLHKAMQERQR